MGQFLVLLLGLGFGLLARGDVSRRTDHPDQLPLGVRINPAPSRDPALREQVKGKTKSQQAKAVGKAVAERAKAAGVSLVVFDRGGYPYHGRVKALAEGSREGGLEF